MTTSSEASELIQYSCERCKTRFVLPPSSRRLGIAGTLHAFSMGVGRSLKKHQGLGDGIGDARRELLAKMDDDAYQAFVLSFRFCHECRQFVCNDCWSKSRGTCLTCAARASGSPARAMPIVAAGAAAGVAVPKVPRPIVTSAPQRRGRTRRDFGLIAATLAIVLISIEGGVLLLNATTGPTDISAGQTNGQTPAPGSSAARQWVVTPPPDASGSVTPGSNGPTTSDNPTASLAPGATTPPATPPPPRQPPRPTPKPGELIIYASGGSMFYGGPVPTITASYAGFTGSDNENSLTTKPTCTTVATSSSPVGNNYTSSCTGAVDHKYVISYFNGLVGVNPASLTVRASDGTMTYGGTVPTITAQYTGFVNSDTSASLTTLPTCSTTATSSSPVIGTYSSSCTGATASNYTISEVAGTVTVNQAQMTITASSHSIIYGAAAPSVTPSFSPNVDPGGVTCETNYSPGPGTGDAGGSYTTSCTAGAGSNPNYAYTNHGGTVTVAARHLQVTANNPTPIVVGDLPPAYDFTITSGSFYPGDDWIPGHEPTCTSDYVQGNDAGPYTIICSGGDPGSNYWVGYSDGTLTVNPAP